MKNEYIKIVSMSKALDRDLNTNIHPAIKSRDWPVGLSIINHHAYKLKRKKEKTVDDKVILDNLILIKLLIIDYIKDIYDNEELLEIIS